LCRQTESYCCQIRNTNESIQSCEHLLLGLELISTNFLRMFRKVFSLDASSAPAFSASFCSMVALEVGAESVVAIEPDADEGAGEWRAVTGSEAEMEAAMMSTARRPYVQRRRVSGASSNGILHASVVREYGI
jgi:hypothetical protein